MLPAPALQYHHPLPAPKGGAWNLRDTRFHTGASFDSYAVVSFMDARRVGRQGDPGSLMVGTPPPPPLRHALLGIIINGNRSWLGRTAVEEKLVHAVAYACVSRAEGGGAMASNVNPLPTVQ